MTHIEQVLSISLISTFSGLSASSASDRCIDLYISYIFEMCFMNQIALFIIVIINNYYNMVLTIIL